MTLTLRRGYYKRNNHQHPSFHSTMFGFGTRKIDLQISKYDFSPGEIIQGSISLNVKKQTKAKAVTLRLVGQQKTTKFSSTPNAIPQTKKAYIYDFKQPLDGEKEYLGEYHYNFQIKIPENILGSLTTAFGSVLKSAEMLLGQSSQIKWYLIASLDIPWGIDTSKKVQITIL